MNKSLFACALLPILAACTPLHQDVVLQHAQRNCRVEAEVSKDYAIDSTGVNINSVAYQTCMAHHGFVNGVHGYNSKTDSLE